QDIEIRYSGIRPGEKLFEELFSKDEKYTKTQNSRIFIVESENKINEKYFQEVILKIKNAIHENNYDEIEELIREYIPEAKSYIKRDMAI
ncbi:MAG TPA: polysaccharide biosynthesis protein, partial [Tepiditoga sp.]|nr:polysaccharide biosynthesis protein [Tepiditoga sp.]